MSAHKQLKTMEISIQIIVWNSFHNKYGKHRKSLNLPQPIVFFKNWEVFFAFIKVLMGLNNVSFDNSMQ